MFLKWQNAQTSPYASSSLRSVVNGGTSCLSSSSFGRFGYHLLFQVVVKYNHCITSVSKSSLAGVVDLHYHSLDILCVFFDKPH